MVLGELGEQFKIAYKENTTTSLVGQVIKESKGRANPQIVIILLKELT